MNNAMMFAVRNVLKSAGAVTADIGPDEAAIQTQAAIQSVIEHRCELKKITFATAPDIVILAIVPVGSGGF